MLYNWNGQTLDVEYSFYDADEGQPVISVSIDAIRDLGGNLVQVPRDVEVKISLAAFRHQKTEARKAWAAWKAQPLPRPTRAAESCPARTPVIPFPE
jgi:hypothetical protein